MAVLKQSRNQSSHWYKADGAPCHFLPRASGGGRRATTLADAKRLGLLPSVTSILDVFSKPQLDNWKLRQVALASMRLTRTDGESDEYLVDRIIEEAFEQVRQAAYLGTRIHHALDQHFEGVAISDDLTIYTDPVLEWKNSAQLEFVERELCVVNLDYGYAGTMDVACRRGESGIGVIDFKTRRTKRGEKVTPYEGQEMQIAAYGAAYWGESKLSSLYGANVYISSTEPGRIEVCYYELEQLMAEWEVFKMACAIWRHSKGYDPRQKLQAQNVDHFSNKSLN